MDDVLKRKEESLRAYIRGLGSCAIAFSGGVDSSLLLAVAQEELQEDVVAVTVVSAVMPGIETDEASAFCRERGIRHIFCVVDAMKIPGFAENGPDRCYVCKKALFERIRESAGRAGVACVAEGSNLDDLSDYRPGLRALEELGIQSPLREAGLNKAEIRALAQQMGLSVSTKPSAACLASRIPYGERITTELLEQIGRAEQLMAELGFRQLRVRAHGSLARIEVAPEEMERLWEPSIRQAIDQGLKDLGFTYVAADLEGYRTGSLNETLDERVLQQGQARGEER